MVLMSLSPGTPKDLLLSTPVDAWIAFEGFEITTGDEIKGKVVSNSTFKRVSFKKIKISHSVFSHCLFEDCYFRSTDLQSVSFVGCHFRNCEFDGARIIDCDFSYAEFHNCSISYKQIKRTLPQRQNLRWRLARSLRVNSSLRGDKEDFRQFLLEEIRASEQYYYKKAFEWDEKYYGKYKWNDRVEGFLKWGNSKLNKFIWGYGEHPFQVLLVSLGIVVFFAALYRLFALGILPTGTGASFFDYLQFSFLSFTNSTHRKFNPISDWGHLFAAIESILGIIAFGFFVTALFQRISKR